MYKRQVYVTLLLATLGGMILGLLASAIAPNANAAPLIVILFVIPQVVLGGALIPVPTTASAQAADTRRPEAPPQRAPFMRPAPPPAIAAPPCARARRPKP